MDKSKCEYKKLGDCCRIFNGNSINADYKKKHFTGLSTGYPFIATKDVSFNGEINYDNGVRIPFETDYKKANPGSVFVCAEGGSAGRKIARVNKKVCFGNKLFCIEPRDGIIGDYLYYYLNSYSFQKQFKEQLAGLIGGVNAKKFNNFVFPSLSLADQQEIVDYLDKAFAKIDALKKNAEQQLSDAKALFSAALEESMTPKEGWESQTLDKVCFKITDGTHNSPVNTERGDYMYITAKNIKTYGLDLKDITFVSKQVHNVIFARCNPEKGDVLYIKDGATTGIAIVNPLDNEFSLLSSVALLKPNKELVSGEYLCYMMNSPQFYNYVRSKMEGAAITRVTLTKIKNFSLAYPSLPEQQAIVAHLDTLSAKVNQLQENYNKILRECDALKQALLREIFE